MAKSFAQQNDGAATRHDLLHKNQIMEGRADQEATVQPARLSAIIHVARTMRRVVAPVCTHCMANLFLLCVLCVSAVNFLPSISHAQNRQAQLSWWDRSAEAKCGHYWVKTDLSADEANSLARHMNIMYEEYSKRLASLPVRVQEKLNVLIFKDRQDYMLTLRARFGVNPAGTGGLFFVNQSGTALAFWIGDLPRRRIEHVIQHEGFHQFAYSRFGDDLPIWVNEGLAEFFGEAVIVGNTLVIGQSTPRVLDSIKQAIELNKYVPFEKMLTFTHQQWGAALQDGSAAINYNQAWSMVHFLVYGDNGKYVNAFETYLKHINSGLPSREAFVRSFGNDIAAFEKVWKQYAQAAKPSAFVTALERMEFLAEGAMELNRQGINPETLDALRDELRKINFVHTINTHGVEMNLKAEDDAMFKIPIDDLTSDQPVFVVSKTKLTGLTLREKKQEETNPTPPAIATDHLKPRGLQLKWLRSKDGKAFTYEIVVK